MSNKKDPSMITEHKLSLTTAVLININIMMGAGIFINTVELSKRAGLLSGFMYLFIGVLISPLILVIAQLLKLHPSGGFYTFAQQEIHPFAGFISTWSYFIAKLASAMLMIHVSASLITQIFPSLLQIGSVYFFDIFILTLFILLNTRNLKTGSRIQMGFLFFKLIPVFFVIATGILVFSPSHVINLPLIWHGIPSSIPFVLYAAMGFEAICAVSHKIEDSQRNGPKSIFISVIVVITLITLFQLLFYCTLGTSLASQSSYLGAFPTLLNSLFPLQAVLVSKLQAFFYLAIACSALGGCYGILFSNNWNLYILAQKHHILFPSFFTRLNKHAIPMFCLLIEWVICVLFLYISNGNQAPLQQTAGLGTTIGYFFCVLALWYAYQRTQASKTHKCIALLGFFSCAILIGSCIRNFLIAGISPLISFLCLLTAGIIMYFFTIKQSNAKE